MGVRQDILKEHHDLPILHRAELLSRIKGLDGYYPSRDRALVAFLYLTGCRIEEVVKYIREKNPHRTITVKARIMTKQGEVMAKRKVHTPFLERETLGLPIKKSQVEVRGDIIIINAVRSLKHHDGKRHTRNIPIIYNELEKELVHTLFDYIDTLKDDAELFPMVRSRAYQILGEVGLYPHYLRHIRLTHLTTDYDFTEMQLRQFTGWTDGRPAADYTHLNVKNIIQTMTKKR